jgi:redox-sensitive bicupin YhaK (pirin superfamily)
LQVIKGNGEINGIKLKTGDAISSQDEQSLKFIAAEDSEVILFDLL